MDSLGTLAGGIAHDFNNILAGIMGYIDILSLESDGFTETQKEYLKNAEIGCNRAADLISKFQALSRGSVSEKTSVDIYGVAQKIFDSMDVNTGRIIEKRLDLKPGEFYVLVNPSELNQVFLNLGTNAVQALESRDIKQENYIRITAIDYKSGIQDRTRLPEGEYIHILFEDNGIGMSGEVRRKAFNPLFTTKEKCNEKGQGLGMAIVYNIVTRIHNGHIEIESEEGKGTIIHIYLTKGQPKKETKTKEDKGIIGGTETILVVDDETIILGLAKNILKKYGYNVLTAVDGEKALEIYKEQVDSIDGVILDLTMPKMSGGEAFEKMLKLDTKVKVIISSGHSDEDTRKGILSLAKGYVKKPYRIMELTTAVREVLDS